MCCQSFRQHSHLDQEDNEEACYSLKDKTPQASNHVRHQQTSPEEKSEAAYCLEANLSHVLVA